MLYNIVRLRTNKTCDNRFFEINIRSVNAGIVSWNGVSNMQTIMIHLNLPICHLLHGNYNKILNNIAQYSTEIAEECFDKASWNFILRVVVMMRIMRFTLKIIKVMWKSLFLLHYLTIEWTWREWYGFNSLWGVIFIISVDTGEVLDFKVKCKRCFKF